MRAERADFVSHPLGRASVEFVLLSKPHEYWRWLDHTATYSEFKKEMWDHTLTMYWINPWLFHGRNAGTFPRCSLWARMDVKLRWQLPRPDRRGRGVAL